MLQESFLQKGYSVHGGDGQTPIIAVEMELAKSTKEMLKHAGLELGPVLKGGGVLLGSLALTFRGFGKHDFGRVADVLDHAIQVTGTWEAASTTQDGQQSTGGLGERWPMERGADLTSLKREVESLIDTRYGEETETSH